MPQDEPGFRYAQPVLSWVMDPITLAFYAIVCGCLSAVAPNFPRLPVRLGIGAIVGIAAAAVLPEIKGMLHLY